MQKHQDGPFDISGRVVIVTGAGAGLGKAYCHELARLGARVVCSDIDREAANRCADELSAAGWQATGTPCDVADAGSVDGMVRHAVEHFGAVDALINNAALMSTLPRGPWHSITEADWDRVMAVNTRGLFLCCRAVYPHMKRRGGGKIVNISSNRVFDGTPNRLHYTTSKAGVIGFTRALAREVGDDNICVNAVTPGFTASDTQVASTDPGYAARMEALNERKALKRTQVPGDLVGTVVFLVSPASGFITGQTINVDGGFVMH